MSACIRIESGVSAGTIYWIDRPVLRVGSDPSCELCLPSAGLKSHAITLEFRSGQYTIYNRAENDVQLAGVAVAAGERAHWPVEGRLILGGETELAREIDGDPAPSPSPDNASMEEDRHDSAELGSAETADAASDETSPKSSKSMVQLSVIGACMLCCVIFVGSGSGDSQTETNVPDFAQIVATSMEEDVPTSARKVVQQLQLAQAALVRGHQELAKRRFAKLRDRLVIKRDELTVADRQLELQALAYVEFRLGQLQ